MTKPRWVKSGGVTIPGRVKSGGAVWNNIHREQSRGDNEGHMNAEAESRCRGNEMHTWLTARREESDDT